jgi:hypothetical protein
VRCAFPSGISTGSETASAIRPLSFVLQTPIKTPWTTRNEDQAKMKQIYPVFRLWRETRLVRTPLVFPDAVEFCSGCFWVFEFEVFQR